MLPFHRRRASAAVAPRDTAMHNQTAAIPVATGSSWRARLRAEAARLADLQQRSQATDAAAAGDLQQLLLQGQQLADAMTAAADAVDADRG